MCVNSFTVKKRAERAGIKCLFLYKQTWPLIMALISGGGKNDVFPVTAPARMRSLFKHVPRAFCLQQQRIRSFQSYLLK